MSLTLAPSASSPTLSKWIPPSWSGRSESHLELRNRAKRGTQKNHHSAFSALLDPLLQELRDFTFGGATLTGAISSAFPLASNRWQERLDRTPPLLESGPGSESVLIAMMRGAPRQLFLRPLCARAQHPYHPHVMRL